MSTSENKIILAGGSGFLGQALARHFNALGWEVVVLTRKPSTTHPLAREVAWDGETPGQWTRELDGATALVNLTGRSVDCRYTPANRRIIMDSRVKPTRILGEAVAKCATPPRVWLNASSAAIYRHTLDAPWDETGTDFAPTPAVHDEFSLEVIHAWERAFNAAMHATACSRCFAAWHASVSGDGWAAESNSSRGCIKKTSAAQSSG
jgi:uncharacterized protein